MRMFEDRLEAGRELADALSFLKGEDVIVLAIPNGGLPIAEIISQRLEAPLDVLLMSRLHAPRNPDHVVGAVDEHGRISLIESTARWHHLTTQKMIAPAREAFRDMQRTRTRFRAVIPELEVRGKTVIVVNDGVSTGATMIAAISSVRDRGATKVVAAAPAGAQEATWQLRESAHMVVIPHVPAKFKGIDKFYKQFPDLFDETAVDILKRHMTGRSDEPANISTVPLRFIVDSQRMIYCEAELPTGEGPFPCVILVHGYESDCRSIRSAPISRRLAKRGVIGVRMDFQGHGRSDGIAENCTLAAMVSDIRVVFENLACDKKIDVTRMGLCGAGTGAMASLLFAAKEKRISTIAIRGPVCHGEATAARDVEVPTIIIHAEGDTALEPDVEKINELLTGQHELLCIPESNRLFNDPISMELMVSASVDWLYDHLQVSHQEQAMTVNQQKETSAASE